MPRRLGDRQPRGTRLAHSAAFDGRRFRDSEAMSPSNRKKYLFIRLLEACNADCFMCEYALSPDRYRFTLAEFRNLLPSARTFGVGFVRFTGGEPLLHREAVELVRAGAETGMKMS